MADIYTGIFVAVPQNVHKLPHQFLIPLLYLYISVGQKKGKMQEKFKSFAIQFVVITGGVLTGLYIWEQINKPKVLPPASATTSGS